MRLRDILTKGKPVETIMARTNDPFGECEDGILFGYCQWDGEKLISLDGDYYSLEEEIVRFEYENENYLVYWIHSEWLHGTLDTREGDKHEDPK